MDYFKTLKPNPYMNIKNSNGEWFSNEYREYYFPTPVEYINNKSYWQYDKNSYERENWAKIYWNSYKYNYALDSIMNESNLWNNYNEKNEALNIVYNYIVKKSIAHGSITPLSPFEIFLMNDGFRMKNFCALNAMAPMFRSYEKNGKIINLGFGCDKTNFYFIVNNNFPAFQVNNDISTYNDAIDGKLKPI